VRIYSGTFGFFHVQYSTLLHLPPLRFHCVGGCCYQTHAGLKISLVISTAASRVLETKFIVALALRFEHSKWMRGVRIQTGF
jgi:hypothetical protein